MLIKKAYRMRRNQKKRQSKKSILTRGNNICNCALDETSDTISEIYTNISGLGSSITESVCNISAIGSTASSKTDLSFNISGVESIVSSEETYIDTKVKDILPTQNVLHSTDLSKPGTSISTNDNGKHMNNYNQYKQIRKHFIVLKIT